MLHLNDDSNDDLFRKAAEDYFLGADTPDWKTFLNKNDIVVTGVQQEQPAERKIKIHYRNLPVFVWLHNKALFGKLSSFLRAFSFKSRPDKSKKKINTCFRSATPLYAVI